MGVILILIVLFATLIGSICGMGGGVIIKPLLDAISSFSTFQISIISSTAVLAMSISSLIKHAISKRKLDIKLAILLSIGSIIGSIIGDVILNMIKNYATLNYGDNASHYIKIIQNSILFVIMSLVLIYMIFIKKKDIHFNVKSSILKVVVGFTLGFLSILLDIGGPMNVCVLVLVFGLTSKEASISSLIIIFFAKVSKFIKLFAEQSFSKNILFDNSLNIYMFIGIIICAMLGGIIGANINKKFKEEYVNITYCSSIGLVIILSLYNIINNVLLLS